jgi:hypothetical protein
MVACGFSLMVGIAFLSFYGADYCWSLFAAIIPAWYAASSAARSCQTARSWKSRESDFCVSSVGTLRCSSAMSSRTLSVGCWCWLFMHHIHALVCAHIKSNKADFRRILSGEEPQHYADLGRRRGRGAQRPLRQSPNLAYSRPSQQRRWQTAQPRPRPPSSLR